MQSLHKAANQNQRGTDSNETLPFLCNSSTFYGLFSWKADVLLHFTVEPDHCSLHQMQNLREVMMSYDEVNVIYLISFLQIYFFTAADEIIIKHMHVSSIWNATYLICVETNPMVLGVF